MLLLQVLFGVTVSETSMIKSALRASQLWQFVYGGAVRRKLSISARALMFYESDTSGGEVKPTEYTPYEHWRDGVKIIGDEVSKFKEEVFWKFRCDNLAAMQHGDYEVVWKFDSQEMIDSWMVTADQDNNHGHSSAELVLTPNHHALFRGHIDTTLPKDGIIKRTGYCNMRSPPNFVRSLIHFYLFLELYWISGLANPDPTKTV